MAPVDASDILAALPLPAVLIGPSGRVEAANAAAAAFFGHDPTGRAYVMALRQPSTLDAVEATFRDGAPREARLLGREAGRDTTWRATVRTVGAGVLVTLTDETAVEEAGRSRRDFVANVSHELRSPLTALLGLVETLRGPAREDAAARDRFLGTMAREAARMARLVDDLLSLSRVESEERRRPTDPVDLAAVLRAGLAAQGDLASRSGAVIERSVPEGPVMVQGDARQLGAVVSNLVENAIKYGGGRVEVELSGPAEDPALGRRAVRLTVADRGQGIAAHHLPRLTERFYRVDAHRSRDVGGTGLGLAIVKHIVGRHRGRLRIESEVGQGSRFTVILPAD